MANSRMTVFIWVLYTQQARPQTDAGWLRRVDLDGSTLGGVSSILDQPEELCPASTWPAFVHWQSSPPTTILILRRRSSASFWATGLAFISSIIGRPTGRMKLWPIWASRR